MPRPVVRRQGLQDWCCRRHGDVSAKDALILPPPPSSGAKTAAAAEAQAAVLVEINYFATAVVKANINREPLDFFRVNEEHIPRLAAMAKVAFAADAGNASPEGLFRRAKDVLANRAVLTEEHAGGYVRGYMRQKMKDRREQAAMGTAGLASSFPRWESYDAARTYARKRAGVSNRIDELDITFADLKSAAVAAASAAKAAAAAAAAAALVAVAAPAPLPSFF